LQGSPDRVPLTPIGGRAREPLLIAALVVLGVTIAIVKPWDRGAAGEPGIVVLPATNAPIVATAVSPTPSATPRSSADAACYYGLAWRLFTVERNAGRLINTWYSVEPVQACGPTDPNIPVIRMYTVGLQELGYCTVTVPDGPRPILSTEGWRLSPSSLPEPLPLVRTGRFAPADPNVGVLYAPPPEPDGGRPANWAPGRYVFVFRYGPEPSEERWFETEIITIEGLPTASALPSPSGPAP
jgi:hypothetical protein